MIQLVRELERPSVERQSDVDLPPRHTECDVILHAPIDVELLVAESLIVEGCVRTGRGVPRTVEVVTHEVEFRQYVHELVHLDVRDFVRRARQGRREAVHLPRLPRASLQRSLYRREQ